MKSETVSYNLNEHAIDPTDARTRLSQSVVLIRAGKKKCTFNLNLDLAKLLKVEAAVQNREMTELLEEALSAYLMSMPYVKAGGEEKLRDHMRSLHSERVEQLEESGPSDQRAQDVLVQSQKTGMEQS